MKKINKSLLYLLLGVMTMSGCGETSSSTTVSSSSNVPASTSTTTSSVPTSSSITNPNSSSSSELSGDALILDELAAKVIIAQNNTEVVNNFNLPATVKFREYVGEVTWVSDSGYVYIDTVKKTITDSASGATYDVYEAVIVRPENGEGDANVRLTATISYNGLSVEKVQKVTVPELGPSTANSWGTMTGMKVSSWAEWRAQESGTIAVKGVITGMVYQEQYSNANVFLQDADGGYYAYAVGEMSLDEANNYLAVGNEVVFEGEKSVYHGLHEFNQEKVTGIEVLQRDVSFEAVDVTDAATANDLYKYQAMWVKATGMYVEEAGKAYMKFGDYKYEIYHSAKYSGSYFDVVEKQLENISAGDTVEITGMIGSYDADQFHPYNMVKVEGSELSPEEKAEIALSSAESALFAYKGQTISLDTEIELFASSEEDVVISYSLDAEADTTVYVLEGNKLTIKPVQEEKNATLTISVSVGGVTKSSTFDFKACASINIITVAEALEIAGKYEHNTYTEDEYYIQGTLEAITNATYGNTSVTQGDSSITIYGMYGDDDAKIKYGDIEGDKPVEGDIVILKGILGTYNNKCQMKNAFIYDFNQVITVEKAISIAGGFEHNTYTEEEYYVKGTLEAITNATYGNTSITDGTNSLSIYGLYGDDEATIKYGEISGAKPVEGDSVVLKGVLGTYNSKCQMKNAYAYSFETNTIVEPEEPGTTEPTDQLTAPTTFDASTMKGISTSYGEYADLTINDQPFSLSCGNLYNSDGNAVAVGINKSTNLSKAGALPTAISTALGDKVLTDENTINASLEMDFDVNGVTSVTYNFKRVGYGGEFDTTIYILRSVDGGQSYSIVATGNKSSTSLSYTEDEKVEKARYALVVTGGADSKYGAYARVTTIDFK